MVDELEHLNLKQDYFYLLKVGSIDLTIYDGENANPNKHPVFHNVNDIMKSPEKFPITNELSPKKDR